MAKVTLHIYTNAKYIANVNNFTSEHNGENAYFSNISKFEPYGYVFQLTNNLFPTEPNDGMRVFILGGNSPSVLGEEYGWQLCGVHDYNGYFLGVSSGDMGEYEWELVPHGENLLLYALRVDFDKLAEQRAKKCDVYTEHDGRQYEHKDLDMEQFYQSENPYSVFIETPDGYNITKIVLKDWSVPNYPPCITHLALDADPLVLGKHQLLGLNNKIETYSSPAEISYDLIPATGTYEIQDDEKNTLRKYGQRGWLASNVVTLELRVNNRVVSHATTESSPYYDLNQTISMSIADSTALWANVNHEEILFQGEHSLYDVLVDVLSRYRYQKEAVDLMLQKYIVIGKLTDEEIKYVKVIDYLQSITVPSFTLAAGTVRQSVNKICNVAQLKCYQSSDGSIQFISARPIDYIDSSVDGKQIYIVTASKQSDAFKTDIILQNIYNKVEIKE